MTEPYAPAIETGIPIPPPRTNRKSGTANQRRYPFPFMQVGDSFFVPCVNTIQALRHLQQAVSSAAGLYAKRHPPLAFLTRAIEGGVRCWRVA